jgi:hypothetical protein
MIFAMANSAATESNDVSKTLMISIAHLHQKRSRKDGKYAQSG